MGLFGNKHVKDLKLWVKHGRERVLEGGTQDNVCQLIGVMEHTMQEGAGQFPPELEAEAREMLAKLRARIETTPEPQPIGERMGLCLKCGAGDYFIWSPCQVKLGSQSGSNSPHLTLAICQACGRAEWYACNPADADKQGASPSTLHVDPPEPPAPA